MSQDISNEMFDRLMACEGEVGVNRNSESESLLHNSASPFNNSFMKNENDLVVQTMRKNSLDTSG